MGIDKTPEIHDVSIIDPRTIKYTVHEDLVEDVFENNEIISIKYVDSNGNINVGGNFMYQNTKYKVNEII